MKYLYAKFKFEYFLYASRRYAAAAMLVRSRFFVLFCFVFNLSFVTSSRGSVLFLLSVVTLRWELSESCSQLSDIISTFTAVVVAPSSPFLLHNGPILDSSHIELIRLRWR